MRYEKDTDYKYVNRYESSARRLLTKFSASYINSLIGNIEDLEMKIEYWTKCIENATPEEKDKYNSWITEANEKIEEIKNISPDTPDSYRTALKNVVEYKEYNSYYRMLNGYPAFDADDTAYVSVYNEDIMEYSPIHTQSYTNKMHWLNSADGIKFMKLHGHEAKYQYLKHMTTKRIPPYIARLAKRFEVLYCAPTNPSILGENFLTIYTRSLDYIIRIFYSDAYRNTEGELYEGFIGMAILFMTISEMYYTYLEADISRDFYDMDSLQIIYEAYGVPFYDSIPLKFHKKIVKNINTLIAHKGSNKVFVDLCDIFDYDILGIYQYYLFKERKMDINNNPSVVWKTVDGKPVSYDEAGNPTNLPKDEFGKPVYTPDLEKMYDIYFVKTNTAAERYPQLIDSANKVSYTSIVSKDPYWFHLDQNTIREVYQNQYNYIETKYIGVQLMFNMTDLLWESAYFMGMLRDNRSKISSPLFRIAHDRLGEDVPLFDMLIYIITLICKKRGYTGEIRSLLYRTDSDGNYLDENGEITTSPEEYIPLPLTSSRILGFNFKGICKTIAALRNAFLVKLPNNEQSLNGLNIKKDFYEGQPFHPMNVEIGNDFFHGDDIQDWILRNKAFIETPEGQALIEHLFSDPNTKYFDNLNIHKMEDICKAYKAMKGLKSEIDELMYNTPNRELFNALKDLSHILYTTEILEDVFKDPMTGDIAKTYADFLKSLNPKLYYRYEDDDIDINEELDYCLVQLQNLCDALKYMIYIDELDADVITDYLYKMLRFFKSAKADLTDFNIIFFISNRTENMLKFLEKIHDYRVNMELYDGFRDIYDAVTKACKLHHIYDRDFVFQFTMQLVQDCSGKTISLEDHAHLSDALNDNEPVVTQFTVPLFDKIANIGFGDSICDAYLRNTIKNGFLMHDSLIKTS